MKCRYPVSKTRSVNGATFNYEHRCGQCIQCRITRRKEWTCRILLEALHTPNENSFITLTYDEEHLPTKGVTIDELQRFFKRLRRNIEPRRFRYFAVGEYGDDGRRPHYHAILFGIPADDYFYDRIDKSWGKGIIDVRELIENRAQYIAGYTTKKYTATAEIPTGSGEEFSTMSRNPGIGLGYAGKIATAVERHSIQMVGLDKTRSNELRYIRIGEKFYPLDNYIQGKLMDYLGEKPREVSTARKADIMSYNEMCKIQELKKLEQKEMDTKARKYLKNKRKRNLNGSAQKIT